MRISLSFVLAIAVFALPGCSRKKAEAPPPQAEAPAPSPSPKTETGVPAPPPAEAAPAPEPAVTTKASNDSAYIKEMEQTLNEFLGDYVRANHRIPKDINEMLNLKIITSIPAVPAGKRWVIDQKTGKISAK
jgi:hypothetical protein